MKGNGDSSSSALWYRDEFALLGEIQRARGRQGGGGRFAIPGYDDLVELARGGQGVIYRAVQRSTRQAVAIKVLLEGALASRETRRRFEREVDLVATLRHPHIVRIYDSGADAEQRPYYVMEFIEGVPLDEYVAAWRRSAGGRLTDLLELFAKICDAVHYAHQRGVIHRDIKPSNIRIDASGEPHVLDFGLAKVHAMDDSAAVTQMTASGQFMGSLPWASPEQAEGDPDKIDVRTDVYSLGVIFYELVTGTMPYPLTGGFRKTLENIISAQPAPPRSLNRQLNTDLETIVLKCLAKEPARRYQSAGEIADDVRRYLRGAPINARRDSTAYVLGKLLRRHWLAVSAGAAAVVLIIAFGISMAVLAQAAQQARAAESIAKQAALVDAKRADEARAAESVSKQAALVDAKRAQESGRFLREMLQRIDPAKAKARDTTLLKEVLDESAARVDEEITDPRIAAELHELLANTYMAISNLPAARRHAERAIQLYTETLGAEAVATLNARYGLFKILQMDADPGKLQMAEDLLEDCARVLGLDHKLTVNIEHDYAMSLAESGDVARAEEILLGNLERLRKLGEPDQILTAQNDLAIIYRERGKIGEAIDLYEQVLLARRELLGPDHPQTLVSMNMLAYTIMDQGRFADAEQLLREVIATSTRVLGPDHIDTIVAEGNLSWCLQHAGRLAEAETAMRGDLEKRRRVLGPDHYHTTTSINNLADICWHVGKREECEALNREALEISRRTLGDKSFDTALSLNNLGLCLARQKRLDEALPYYQEAVDIATSVLAGKFDLGYFHGNLGSLLLELGRPDEAEPHLLKAVEVLIPALGPQDGRVKKFINELVQVYESTGRAGEAQLWREKVTPAPKP